VSIRDKLHVMVVDDMSTSRGLLTQGLDALGIQNYVGENDGRAALERLKVRPVHLVISDYNMPNLDGLGLLEALRSEPRTQKTGFVLVTGRATPEIAARGRQLRLNALLRKPFTVPELRGTIEAIVGPL
jgi:two-component system chemotaxis response regulator CheY